MVLVHQWAENSLTGVIVIEYIRQLFVKLHFWNNYLYILHYSICKRQNQYVTTRLRTVFQTDQRKNSKESCSSKCHLIRHSLTEM